ncbi:predicted protein [Nematostella vectensis]|uniref:Uncharacterized protein n=1 Tax=Nematostella vectensis TaxID=45351 RepID=A7SLY3_NEMVE|nr:predicted protein [Nematostella vectensis]|eukprot:XP_001627365.1 predicted protein [Nematostella vectensis]
MSLNWVSKIARISRNWVTRYKYYSNLWIYNSRKSIEVLLYGKKKQTASIPFMITVKMKNTLLCLGYSNKDIGHMTPLLASNIIKHRVLKENNSSFQV